MRIGILTDAHLFHKNAQPQLYKQILHKLQNENVDYIVDCGDVIDTNSINSVQSDMLYDIFSDITTPMHIVMGNHESLGGVSLTSILKINKNIFVHNNLEIQDNMLFIPYINDITKLKQNLDELNITSPLNCAFSHLNITSNFYAMISFEKSKFLHKYVNTIFNGHIHSYEENKTLYGNIYNIGSFSSLTFSDEHIPSYYIYDEEKDSLIAYKIEGSIIHKTITINDTDEDLGFLQNLQNEYKVKINWRVKLPVNFNFEERNKIKEQLFKLSFTNSVQFTYINNGAKQQDKIINMDKQAIAASSLLIDKLFDNYERDTNTKLDMKIKRYLKEGEY